MDQNIRQIISYLITGYILILSFIGFVVMGVDKRRAIKKSWRIPERTLLFIAGIGGGIGSLIGMYLFRHKTKHWRFVVILPLTAMLYLALLLKMYGII